MAIIHHNGTIQRIWISRIFHGVSANVWGRTEAVRHYFSLAKENERLAERNFQLEQQLRLYEEMHGRHFSATDSLPAKAGNFRYLPASIIKLSRNKQHNYLIIDKGSEDNVRPMSGLITEHGAIGIVDAVSRHYAHVRIFTNTGMSVSARIGHEGAVGTLIWDGRNSKGGILNEIPHHIEVIPGDTVYTSGFSAIFPPDIPLGVMGDKKLVNGSFYEIQVELFEDFNTLRYVTVVDNEDVSELEELENDEN